MAHKLFSTEGYTDVLLFQVGRRKEEAGIRILSHSVKVQCTSLTLRLPHGRAQSGGEGGRQQSCVYASAQAAESTRQDSTSVPTAAEPLLISWGSPELLRWGRHLPQTPFPSSFWTCCREEHWGPSWAGFQGSLLTTPTYFLPAQNVLIRKTCHNDLLVVIPSPDKPNADQN